MKRKLFIVVLAVLMLTPSIMLFAKGAEEVKASKDVVNLKVLTVWSESRFPTWAASIDEFNKTHPNIHVDFEMAGTQASTTRMQTEMLGNNPPDVIHFWKFMLNEYAQNDQLVALNPYLEKSGKMEGYFYDPVLVWNSPAEEGVVYGLSDFLGPSVFFYNVKMFKDLGLKVPTNLDELLAVVDKLPADVLPMVGDWKEPVNILDTLAKIQVQTTGRGPILETVEGKNTFPKTKGLLEAVTIMKKIVDKGLIVPKALAYDQNGATSAFISGRAAIYSDKSHATTIIDLIKPDDFEYAMFTVDFVENPVNRYSSTFGSDFAIPKKSKHPDEAWTFMNWMWSKEWQQENVVNQGQLSSIATANKEISHPIAREVAETILPYLTDDSFYLVDLLPQAALNEFGTRMHQLVLGEINDPMFILQSVQDAMDR